METNKTTMEINETTTAEMPDDDRLIKYLRGLNMPAQNRAALANLRRGLGKPPKTVMEMYPYLGQFLSHEPKPRYETAVFIVAALFAYYPDAPGNVGNLGDSIRRMKDDSDSIEKRFVALLNAEAEDLPYYLRQIIGLLKSKEIAVNWNLLLNHVTNWNSDKRYVQTAWARSFWGNFSSDKNKKSEDKTGGNE
ncbi:MAG TPA: type I-E CRISPR-associated protein Cse2/CasB [Pyrinomonadaceae bacterium]|nr:type I-E CRISPR-associated protein Cse2/CasB [Pyrinomonadaceae bacterium]